MQVYDLVILGSNVSAITAAIYVAMSSRPSLYISCPGLKHKASGVNNYLGFSSGTYDVFHEQLKMQLGQFKMETREEDVAAISAAENSVEIQTSSGAKIITKSVIVAHKEVLEKASGPLSPHRVFLCGPARSDNQDLVSLAGTGAMAAIDARNTLNEE